MIKMNILFVKLMSMTTSDNDGEALIAIRKANKILREAKVSWQELLDAAATQQRLPPQPEPDWQNVNTRVERYSNKFEIDGMFNRAFAKNNTNDFEEFLSSVHIWWLDKGWLSEKQYRVVKRAAERDE